MAKKKIQKIENKGDDLLDLISSSGIMLDIVERRETRLKDVFAFLRKYKGFVRVLRDERSVNKYIDQCLKNGIVSLDTETNDSLDIHNNIMVGLCLFTPFNRPVYIPVMHTDPLTGALRPGQVRKDFLREKIEQLSNIKIIFHNAKFDVNVVRNNYDIQLPIYWDTMIAAKVLNENRFSNGLKALYVEGIEPFQSNYHVTTFFENNINADLEQFGLYSAIDAYDTYKVYEWQNKELSSPSMSKLRSLLIDLEFKVTEVCADMEWRGFNFNEDYCDNYLITENLRLKALGDKINKLLEPYKDKILDWKDVKGGRGLVPKLDDETGLPVKKQVKKTFTGRGGNTYTKWVSTDEDELIPDPYAGVKMAWPVLLTSPQQVLCLLNCILGITINSTEVTALNETRNEVAILIGKYRHLNHNLTSFFTPYKALTKNGRMYANFNQMGDEDKTVKTGRFSSKEPNLQQLPARQQEDGVRMMFGASRDVDSYRETEGDKVKVYFRDKVETPSGFVEALSLKPGSVITSDEGFLEIVQIYSTGDEWLEITFKEYAV